MLDSAVEHYARQARITALGLIAARRARDQGNAARLAAVVVGAQLAAVAESTAAVADMLNEQGITSVPAGQVAPVGLVGVASDGRDLMTLLALAQTAAAFDRIVETQLQDVARNASSLAIASRPQVTGYVRMINPGACSRCVVQAGKWFRWNEGFERHPRCGCRHVPARENVAGDLSTDPRAYFESLTSAEQDRTFTKAGAQAIRDGADIGKVVNARSGMSTAQVALRGPGDRWTASGALEARELYGRSVFTTTESTTRRGDAYRAMRDRGRAGVGKDVREKGQRYHRTTSARLMPESIYEIATDRADAIRLLKLYGYIT